MTAQLIGSSEGATLILTLSNPEFRNALGPEMYAAGVEALNAAESSPEVRSVIITGEGGLFSAGGNLQRLQANRQKPPEHQAQSIEGLHNWIEAIRAFPKPVIAAVEGAAAGAGMRHDRRSPRQRVCDGLQQYRLVPRWRRDLELVACTAASSGQRVADVR